jgi:hypothetical protein
MKANDVATIGSGGMSPSPLPSADASARVERTPLPGKFDGELRQAIAGSSDHKRARANVERGGRPRTGGTKHTLTVAKRPWLFMLRPLTHARHLLAKLILLSCSLLPCATPLASNSTEVLLLSRIADTIRRYEQHYTGTRINVTDEICPLIALIDPKKLLSKSNFMGITFSSRPDLPDVTMIIASRSTPNLLGLIGLQSTELSIRIDNDHYICRASVGPSGVTTF